MVHYYLNKVKSQSGRSMIEMIAVLMLIGVLSVGALAGYNWAIEKHRANVLEDEIMQRIADVKMQLDRPHAVANLDKWDETSKIGHPIDLDQDEEFARIHVHQVSSRLCHFVTEDLENLFGVSRIEVDGNSCDKDDNKITFYLSKLDIHPVIKPNCTCQAPKVCDENNDCVCGPNAPIGHDVDTCECPGELVSIRGKCLCSDESEPIDGACGGCSSDTDCVGGQTCKNHVCTCVRKECSASDFTDTLCACCPSSAPEWVEDEGVCKACDEIDVTMPVYNIATKTCEACPVDKPVWDSVNKQCVECVYNSDCGTDGFVCTNNMCECAEGTDSPCMANLIQTIKTSVYDQMCYICGCPSGSTLSGDGKTCVCNNECQTYNTSTKTCANKTNGTACANGLCSNGVCQNDVCPSGTSKSCPANLVATASSKTAYGTQCYTCGCPSGSTLSGSTCVCNNECQTYNASTKTCISKENGITCSDGLCLDGMCKNDTCPSGTVKTCSANLVATASSKTAYGTQCYTCGCPSGSTLSGSTCVCNNECQTYNTSTKTCTNKTNGTACTNGLCKNGTCTNDTCTSGVKTCSSGYTATKVSTTTYGTACYQCCASPKVWNGSSCACPSNTPQYASTSTCACASGETNQNGVCTPSLYPTCKTYCQNRKSTTTGTFQNCRNTTTTSKLNLVLYLEHSVAVDGTKTYTLVSSNTLKTTGANDTYRYKLGSGSTYFETFCEYGYATKSGSSYNLEWVKASTNSLCNGLISGSSTSCPMSASKEVSNAQKTTCDSFCNTYASRYGW